MCGTGSCQVLALNITLLTELHAVRSTTLDSFFFTTVTWAGSPYLLLPLAMAFALLDRCSTNCLQRWFVPLVLASTLLVVQSAKLLVARPRPTLFEALIALPADHCFRSALRGALVFNKVPRIEAATRRNRSC